MDVVRSKADVVVFVVFLLHATPGIEIQLVAKQTQLATSR